MKNLALESLSALVLAAALTSCAHTRQTETAAEDASQQASSPEQPSSREQAGPAPEQAAAQGRGSMVAGGPKAPEETPVATSPRGLLKPGAERDVRQKLGMDERGSLREALKKFQRSHDLPATGILDHRTAEKLGLDPDELFERARAQ